MNNYLNSYLEMAKELVKEGTLDPNDDSFMNEIYNGIADHYVYIFGEKNREIITGFIQKKFESALL